MGRKRIENCLYQPRLKGKTIFPTGTQRERTKDKNVI
ncbi:MAG: hypothetical protein ACI8RD_000444 [Bacillariaceae sp.]|jgi:hypothetical protein